MSRSRTIALLVLLVLAGYDFGFQPQRLVASFKALRCCTEHCQKPRPISAAERCCGVAQDQAGLRAVHAASPDPGADAIVVLPGVVELPAPTVVAADAVIDAQPSRAPPIFLAKQVFQI